MCLAVPGRIQWIGEGTTGTVPGSISFGEQTREVDLVMVPDAIVGDYVIVHSGYAIRIVGVEEVSQVLDLLNPQ
jgi:hydrogenase expression/formation protein HypC